MRVYLNNLQVEKGELNLTFPIMFNPETWEPHIFPVFFGGTVVRDDFIVSVPSLQLVYFGNAESPKMMAKYDVNIEKNCKCFVCFYFCRGGAWEDVFLDTVGEAQDKGLFKHIRIARFASRTLDHELEKNTRTVIPYFASTFIIMALFSVCKFVVI